MTWPLYSAALLAIGLTQWDNTPALAVLGVASVGLVAVQLWKRPAPKPLTPWLLAFLAVQVVSFFYNHSADIFPLWRTIIWIALYHLPIQHDDLEKGALFSLVVYAPISPFLDENTNIIAMNLWALYFLANRRDLWLRLVVFAAMVITRSDGGLLALGAGIAYQQFGGRILFFAPVALVGMIAVKYLGIYGGSNSVIVRVQMIQHAVAGLLQSPWIGNYDGFAFWDNSRGWGAWHAHNIIADIGYQTGIIGLLILFAIGVAFYRWRWAPTGLIVAFLVHSLVDGPLWFFLPATALFLELGHYSGGLYEQLHSTRCNLGVKQHARNTNIITG